MNSCLCRQKIKAKENLQVTIDGVIDKAERLEQSLL